MTSKLNLSKNGQKHFFELNDQVFIYLNIEVVNPDFAGSHYFTTFNQNWLPY